MNSSQHLSDEAVAAFADGVLRGHARTRATRHTAECAECGHAVREQRAAVLALRTAPAPELPCGLLDRLRGLPQVTPIAAPPTVVLSDGTTMLSTSGAPGSLAALVPAAPHPSRAAHRFGPFAATMAVVALAGALAAGANVDEDTPPVPGTVVNTVERPTGPVSDPMTPLFTSVDVFGAGGR